MKNLSGSAEGWVEDTRQVEVEQDVEAIESLELEEEVQALESVYEKLLLKYNRHKSKTLNDSLVSMEGALRILKN